MGNLVGEENLASYAFKTKTKEHKFCRTCGSSILIDLRRDAEGETDPRRDILAVNVSFFSALFL